MKLKTEMESAKQQLTKLQAENRDQTKRIEAFSEQLLCNICCTDKKYSFFYYYLLYISIPSFFFLFSYCRVSFLQIASSLVHELNVSNNYLKGYSSHSMWAYPVWSLCC